MRSLARLLAASVLASVGLASAPLPASAAGKPVIETVHFEGTFDDAIMTEACGFEVVAHVSITAKIRTFDESTPLREIATIQNNVTFTANGNSVTFVERLASVTKVAPDGTATLSVSGRVFGLNVIGHLVINLDTEEVVYQTGRTVDLQRLCAGLAA
jgi:uncharacterized protein involved in outer membrane biogenesis